MTASSDTPFPDLSSPAQAWRQRSFVASRDTPATPSRPPMEEDFPVLTEEIAPPEISLAEDFPVLDAPEPPPPLPEDEASRATQVIAELVSERMAERLPALVDAALTGLYADIRENVAKAVEQAVIDLAPKIAARIAANVAQGHAFEQPSLIEATIATLQVQLQEELGSAADAALREYLTQR